ncbi:hypothetical protein JCM16303_002980 [Sporobolomyces ruberrimus]
MSHTEKPRSSFVYKLHELLSAEQHPEWLRWISNDTFGITSIESQAKAALAPQWDFRSLASFIRQLSYYSFKRLSDRRRSAERRSHSPSLIVFTHTSGNFARDDINKSLNIPRKLRSRKKSTPGSRRKSSTASSIAFDYEYQDRSPSPEQYYSPQKYEDEVPTQTHMSLSSYQLQPWTLVNETHAAASPRSLPISPPTHISLPTMTIREGPGAYEPLAAESPLAREYPSPVAGPATSAYTYDSPTAVYRDQYSQQTQPQYHHASPTYYYPSHYAAQPTSSASTAFASNELPPIRTITSGLVAPPSPPPDTYAHWGSQQVAAPQQLHRRGSHVFRGDIEDTAPPPPPSMPTAVPSGLVAMSQVDSYYPPSPPPPRHVVHSTHVSPQHQYYPTSTYSCASQASEYQPITSRSNDWTYTTAAYH